MQRRDLECDVREVRANGPACQSAEQRNRSVSDDQKQSVIGTVTTWRSQWCVYDALAP